MTNQISARFVALFSILSGGLHATVVSAQHWTAFPPLEGVFFIAIGILQLFIGAQFLRNPSLKTYKAGLFLNGGMALFYFFLRVLPVPFVGEPEGMETLGMIIASLEVAAVAVSLHWLLTHDEHGETHTLAGVVITALFIVLFGGMSYLGSSNGMAMLMPERTVEHHHGHGGHGHEDKHEGEHRQKTPEHSDNTHEVVTQKPEIPQEDNHEEDDHEHVESHEL